MGLSSLPAPSEGMLCVLLVNTAISISIVKGIVRSILHIVGIRLSTSTPLDPTDNPDEQQYDVQICPSEYNYREEFRNQMPSVQYKSVSEWKRLEHECSVCLSKFEPEAEINKLKCGHVFHKECLEKWMDYWNMTCPLCRNPLLREDEVSAGCFW